MIIRDLVTWTIAMHERGKLVSANPDALHFIEARSPEDDTGDGIPEKFSAHLLSLTQGL